MDTISIVMLIEFPIALIASNLDRIATHSTYNNSYQSNFIIRFIEISLLLLAGWLYTWWIIVLPFFIGFIYGYFSNFFGQNVKLFVHQLKITLFSARHIIDSISIVIAIICWIIYLNSLY